MPSSQQPHSGHEHGITVAENGLGKVSVCPCGVMTLTVACISLRFEPGAFQELRALLNRVPLPQAQAALSPAIPTGPDGAKVH